MGTILDDDEPPPEAPTLRIDDVTVTEAGGNAQFTVTLSDERTGSRCSTGP